MGLASGVLALAAVLAGASGARAQDYPNQELEDTCNCAHFAVPPALLF